MSALETQEGGTHYKEMKIQPVEFIHANNLGFCEATAIKYLCRWRKKGGIQDLRKAIHFIEVLIELETRGQEKQPGIEIKDGPYCDNCVNPADFESDLNKGLYWCANCVEKLHLDGNRMFKLERL